MELFALLGFAGAAMMVLSGFDLFGGDDDQDNTDEAGQTEAEEPLTLVIDETATEVTGTDGGDIFTRTSGSAGVAGMTLDAGAGDDAVLLVDPETDDGANPFEISFDNAEVDLGDGDDTLDAVMTYSDIDGGAGDDLITLRGFAGGTDVTGGAGNDTISGELFSGDGARFDGGEGNDLLDVRLMENITASGGDGNDVILYGQPDQGGAGYQVNVDGGAGDDLLWYQGDPFVSELHSAGDAAGGDGEDLFRVTFTATEEWLAEGSDRLEGGAYDQSITALNITDFDPTEDTLLIEPLTEDDSYAPTTAQLRAGSEAGTTDVVITYAHETLAPRELVIRVNSDTISWDDIAFVGETTPEILA
ncbi:hypothetical protein [Mesobacterium pallidum]|uniref:hypothetical protein n=1 Tax=Mesobacterium pallidum TaxID=2872037 RepID=UPI001EE1FFEC|nr:hypothetical protein [Mesobacterium pallidum]